MLLNKCSDLLLMMLKSKCLSFLGNLGALKVVGFCFRILVFLGPISVLEPWLFVELAHSMSGWALNKYPSYYVSGLSDIYFFSVVVNYSWLTLLKFPSLSEYH